MINLRQNIIISDEQYTVLYLMMKKVHHTHIFQFAMISNPLQIMS